jgi:hypothetical protein
LEYPDFGYPFSWSKKGKLALLKQNDKSGLVMPRSSNNADIYLEKQQECLLRRRVKKYALFAPLITDWNIHILCKLVNQNFQEGVHCFPKPAGLKSILMLAPTNVESRGALRIEDYGKKSCIPIL